MKKSFPCFLLWGMAFCLPSLLFCQSPGLYREVLANGGGSATIGDQKFDYTLGEAFTSSFENAEPVLTQGFHQPEPSVTVGIPEIAGGSGLNVFPNPTSTALHLTFSAPLGQKFDLQLVNATGQSLHLWRNLNDANPHEVDCRALPAGTYWLVANTPEGRPFFRTPFVKAQR
jgi:hypothetical protein